MQIKSDFYSGLLETAKALTEGEPHPIANLSNLAALLGEQLPRINWAGFYLMDGGELLLGPFWGKPACLRIAVGRGVCGTAVKTDSIQRVADVHCFPGHISCDSASESEIVIPLHSGGRVIGVLDIDSPEKNRFDAEDETGLAQLARHIEAACCWEQCGYRLS